MFSLKYVKIFLVFALCAASCRFWQPKPDVNAATIPVAVEAIKSAIPFATKEPETFQAEIVVTANGVASVIFTARTGANRLTIYDFGEKSEFALLQKEGGASLTIARRQKIYAENQTTGDGETSDDLPTAELLNQNHAATYESLGAENGAAKYLVRLADAPNSETVITVDEKINLPVRQEFYSLADGRKTLVSTMELRNFNLQVDAGNFDLPKDYKKISPTELQEILRDERNDERRESLSRNYLKNRQF